MFWVGKDELNPLRSFKGQFFLSTSIVVSSLTGLVVGEAWEHFCRECIWEEPAAGDWSVPLFWPLEVPLEVHHQDPLWSLLSSSMSSAICLQGTATKRLIGLFGFSKQADCCQQAWDTIDSERALLGVFFSLGSNSVRIVMSWNRMCSTLPEIETVGNCQLSHCLNCHSVRAQGGGGASSHSPSTLNLCQKENNHSFFPCKSWTAQLLNLANYPCPLSFCNKNGLTGWPSFIKLDLQISGSRNYRDFK